MEAEAHRRDPQAAYRRNLRAVARRADLAPYRVCPRAGANPQVYPGSRDHDRHTLHDAHGKRFFRHFKEPPRRACATGSWTRTPPFECMQKLSHSAENAGNERKVLPGHRPNRGRQHQAHVLFGPLVWAVGDMIPGVNPTRSQESGIILERF